MKSYEDKLLTNWEEIFRQGLLTFWIFVAIRNRELEVKLIKKSIEKMTRNTYSASEQTLYRVLRKQFDLELLDYREVASPNGPKRKLYTLSPLGKQLLKRFTLRNIELFSQPAVQKIIRKDKK